ncbi:MAG: hypothetical protein EPN88_02255 [Bacteroidetes bacterium]|nr:MAG: hypothetical protein EPN88_02255 [Bacteroidota bacterium]
MRKLFQGSLIIFLSGLVLIFLSCTPLSCIGETESYVKASLYDKVLKKLHSPDSLTMYGLNMETSKLYDKTLNVQPAHIPLNASATYCTYIIRIDGLTDTLKFWYNSYPHLISKECGYTYYHTLDSLTFTNHLIDTVLIRNKRVTTINEENIRIFY